MPIVLTSKQLPRTPPRISLVNSAATLSFCRVRPAATQQPAAKPHDTALWSWIKPCAFYNSDDCPNSCDKCPNSGTCVSKVTNAVGAGGCCGLTCGGCTGKPEDCKATNGCTLCKDQKTCYSALINEFDGCPCSTNLKEEDCYKQNKASLVGCEWCSKDGAEPTCHSSAATMTCEDGTCATALPGHVGFNCPCSSVGNWCLRNAGCCNNCAEQKEKFDALANSKCPLPNNPNNKEELESWEACTNKLPPIDPNCTFCDWKHTGGRCELRKDFCAKENEFCIRDDTCCDGMYCGVSFPGTTLSMAGFLGGGGGGWCKKKKENNSPCLFNNECKMDLCTWTEYDKGLFTCQDPICRTRINKCGGYCAIPGITNQRMGVEDTCNVDECDSEGGACVHNWTQGCATSCASLTAKHSALAFGRAAKKLVVEKIICGTVGKIVSHFIASELVNAAWGATPSGVRWWAEGNALPDPKPTTCETFVDFLGGSAWKTFCLPYAEVPAEALGDACMVAMTAIPYVGETPLPTWFCKGLVQVWAADAMCGLLTHPLVEKCDHFVAETAKEIARKLGAGHEVDLIDETERWILGEFGCPT